MLGKSQTQLSPYLKGEANERRNVQYVAQRIRQIMGTNHNRLDYIVATHVHADHVCYAWRGGIWALLENHGFTVGRLIDRDAGVWQDADGDDRYDDGEVTWRNAGTTSGTAGHWLAYVTNPTNATQLHRETAVAGSTTQIDLGPGVTVTVVESDAEGVMMADGLRTVAGDHTTEADRPSENDYSITLKVSFGSLDYVTGGDTDGAYDTGYGGYTYNNVETVISPRIGRVEILRANHHGSGHSTNQTYVDTLNPDVSIISCGTNTYGHPEQTILDQLQATSVVYLTAQGDQNRNYANAVIVDGDILIRSRDGINYTVNGTAYVASGDRTLREQILERIAQIDRELDEPRDLAERLPQ